MLVTGRVTRQRRELRSGDRRISVTSTPAGYNPGRLFLMPCRVQLCLNPARRRLVPQLQAHLAGTIRVDQGTEFVSRDLDLWAYQRGVTLDFSQPGKPTDNAFIESFNGKFRAECLNAHWFMSLDDARRKCEA